MPALFDLLRPVGVLQQGSTDRNHIELAAGESFDRKCNGLGF